MKKNLKHAVSAALMLGICLIGTSSFAQHHRMNSDHQENVRGHNQAQGMHCYGDNSDNANMKIIRQLMTPVERIEMIDRMSDAKTPQERQNLIVANHAELEKRAKDKGVTLPECLGKHMPIERRSHN
jgi:hypothetical protein